MLFPDGTFHGDESDISLRYLCCHASHVSNHAIYFVVFPLKEVEAVLNPDAAECFEFFAEQVLVPGFRHIISKHHEHVEQRGGKREDSA